MADVGRHPYSIITHSTYDGFDDRTLTPVFRNTPDSPICCVVKVACF